MLEGESRSRSVADMLIAVLLVTATLAGVAGKLFALDKTELAENRILAPRPAWPADKTSIMSFPKRVEAYWNDHFGFRRMLIRSHAKVERKLGVSTSANVVFGKHDYLFYTGERELDSHLGLVPFSDAELAKWGTELEARRQWLGDRKARFLFVIAPDKESVYPEMLPDRFKAVSETPADQFVRYMAQHSRVDVLDLRPAVLAAKAGGAVYWRTDTHWSDYGARAAYEAVMRKLTEWYPALKARPESDFRPRRSDPWSGDLAVMLGITDLLMEPYPELDPRPYASLPVGAPGYRPVSSTRYSEMQGPSPTGLRAVFFHDSFFLPPDERYEPGKPTRTDPLMPRDCALRLVSLFAEQFSHSTFTWQLAFDPQLVLFQNPDVVVEEVVERYLRAGPAGIMPRWGGGVSYSKSGGNEAVGAPPGAASAPPTHVNVFVAHAAAPQR